MAEGKKNEGRRDSEDSGDFSSSSVDDCSGVVVGAAPISVVDDSSGPGESRGEGNGISLAERVAESLLGGDCDLLLQQNERESDFLQWLQALDMQVIGGCRADERMKPLLKANSSGVAEDRLLTYLSEHFEAAEVGLLARCLCIPLVSVRVGKVIKHGTTLCPTSSRGNLNVALLPSSDLRITFVGDDGQKERIATVNGISESSFVAVEEIPADTSGRSFFIRVPDVDEAFYFWLSERSLLLGRELLSKMKDLLERKPTLASLTGLSESRLDCFATQLRTYLLGSNAINTRSSSTTSSTILLEAISDAYEPGQSSRSTLTSAKTIRCRHNGSQSQKMHTFYQGSLSPRSNSFKEGLSRSLSSLRSASREKLKPRRGDINPAVCSSGTTAGIFATDSTSDPCEKDKKFPEVTGSNCASALTFLETLRTVSLPPILSAASERPPVGSLFSPYYCWCPPFTSPSMESSQLSLPFDAAFPLLPATMPPSFLAEPTMSTLSLLAQVPPLDFPSSLLSKQSSQQISTFTPLICDPIVHIPVIDVCSAGQGYLVSAGATAIPSLMIPETESAMEKGARETLRLLISGGSSGPPNSSLMGMLPFPPAVLNTEDNSSMLVGGSRGLYRGLYSGSSNIDAIASGIAAVNLASLSSDRSLLYTGSNSGAMDYPNQVTSGDGIVEGSNVSGKDTPFAYEEENH